jgi:ADP-ribosyl-[dinitrogen reductase] hydrolase
MSRPLALISMRADHAVRHNAAVGALIGLAVGDSLSSLEHIPASVCGAMEPLPLWGSTAAAAFETGEALLRRELLDMGLGPTDIVATAIALADPDSSPPLLGDPDAVLVCTLVRSAMLGQLAVDTDEACSPNTDEALAAVRNAQDFCGAIQNATPPALPLTGALAGLRWGPGAIPAAWATHVTGPVGTRTYGLRQLRRLAERLMQQDAPVPPEPRRSLGPREVAPGLFLSNLHAVPKFLANHPEGAVISLCPTTGAFDNHPVRREFAIHDAGGSKVNPHLSATVDEVLATIKAFHAEERNVLVHCHHGASRTGLILRAWLLDELNLDAEDATTEAQVRWPKASTWNRAFSSEIERRAAERANPS